MIVMTMTLAPLKDQVSPPGQLVEFFAILNTVPRRVSLSEKLALTLVCFIKH